MRQKRLNDYKSAMGILNKLERETDDESVKEALNESRASLVDAMCREKLGKSVEEIFVEINKAVSNVFEMIKEAVATALEKEKE